MHRAPCAAVPHVVAAPDKFRGTATAAEIAAAVGRAARSCGWTVDEIPMADGGEGTLEAVGGDRRYARVTGPLGREVVAEWRLLADGDCGLAPSKGATAVIEAARAAGRQLLPNPVDDEPVRATTEGVGQLILTAVDAGVRRVVVAVGGSATTDGGLGAVSVIESSERLRGANLVVACDVRTPFRSAATVFGPQKGATSAQVALLEQRLEALAEYYRSRFGVDVATRPGAGAAGGLAGGLAALGGRLVPGFTFVAEFVNLSPRLEAADFVITGEGRLDSTSFDGKVVGGVIRAAQGVAPVLCVAGTVAVELDPVSLAAVGEVVSLVDAVGTERAWRSTAASVADVAKARLRRRTTTFEARP